jgi:hypothetical protein
MVDAIYINTAMNFLAESLLVQDFVRTLHLDFSEIPIFVYKSL